MTGCGGLLPQTAQGRAGRLASSNAFAMVRRAGP